MNKKIIEILEIVKAKINSHNEFKTAYDKQLAFDFNILNFFKVGENKTTEILAYFINPKETHGQGDAFLKEFLELFVPNDNLLGNPYVKCEKVITENRRIDLFIEFENKIIAIENKIWADDQPNQLEDYSQYLINKGKDFLLLYLNPYGHQPKEKSIKKDSITKLDEKFNVISYKTELFELINRWIGVCEADNVAFFLKQFRKFLKTEILNNNSLDMKIEEKIIYDYRDEIETITNSYNEIERKKMGTHKRISSILRENFERNFNSKNIKNLTFKCEGVFPYNNVKVFKYGIGNKENMIWIQFLQYKIDLILNYYFENDSTIELIQKAKEVGISMDVKLDYNLSDDKVINLFNLEVDKAIKLMSE